MSIPDHLGGSDGLSPIIVQSQNNLISESHTDLDFSKCVSFWSFQNTNKVDPEGWYFVLPHITCTIADKVYNGIAIKLKHGVGIEWDGRMIFHASTSPIKKELNVYSTYFGITDF